MAGYQTSFIELGFSSVPTGSAVSPCSMEPTPLEPEERERVLAQFELILREHYVHLPAKTKHGDPLAALQALRVAVEAYPSMTETQFSRALTDLVRKMRDRHLDYQLPYARAGYMAYLPFTLAEIRENGQRKYIVSRVASSVPAEERLQPGTEILYWNERPIAEAIAAHADRQPGCSDDARRALAVKTLAMRSLENDGPPDEKSITVRYDAGGGAVTRKFAWCVARRKQLTHLFPLGMAIDPRLGLLQELRHAIFPPPAPDLHPPYTTIDTYAEDLEVRCYATANPPFGYIRFHRFPKVDPKSCQFPNEFVRLLGEMPETGLVIDIRDNPGGSIHITDFLLQTLAKDTIEPPLMELRATPGNLKICSRADPDDTFQLARWRDSVQAAVAAGRPASDRLKLPRPETQCELAPRARAYFGPVVLITSALSYSAADFFAAGFQDHNVGTILGVHDTTGAGGANVVNHHFLASLGAPYQALPKGALIRFPLLRSLRTGRSAGQVLEENGVRVAPGFVHERTRDDVLHDDVDLFRRAAELLLRSPPDTPGQ